jgi:predicted transporter
VRISARLLVLAYLVAGVVVAVSRDYLDSLDTAGEWISAILAVVLWPLLLLGFDVDVRR